MTTYASLTHEDPNPVKRWLQSRRLDDAIALIPAGAVTVLDFGGGDGELCARLMARRPHVHAHCFEPTPEIRWQAQCRLEGYGERSGLFADEAAIPDAWADAVLCTEVFEHLPDAQIDVALEQIGRILKPDGVLIVGTPVEIGPPALIKGLFRILRRPGEADADPRGILKALLRRPHGPRRTLHIAEGRPYHPLHLGFDHRVLMRRLMRGFDIVARKGSPWASGPPWLNLEIYFVARRR